MQTLEILPFYDHYTNFVKNKSLNDEDYVAIVNLNKSCAEIRRLTNTKEYNTAVAEYFTEKERIKLEKEELEHKRNQVAQQVKPVKQLDWTKVAARSFEHLFKTLLTKKESLNKEFIDNSLRNINITKTNLFMQIVGSDNPSLENVDRINYILVNGVHARIDEIILNKLYNKLDANTKRVLHYLSDIEYFKDNASLKSVVDNLVIK